MLASIAVRARVGSRGTRPPRTRTAPLRARRSGGRTGRGCRSGPRRDVRRRRALRRRRRRARAWRTAARRAAAATPRPARARRARVHVRPSRCRWADPVIAASSSPQREVVPRRHADRLHRPGATIDRPRTGDPAQSASTSVGLAASTRLTSCVSAGHTLRAGVASRSRTTTSSVGVDDARGEPARTQIDRDEPVRSRRGTVPRRRSRPGVASVYPSDRDGDCGGDDHLLDPVRQHREQHRDDRAGQARGDRVRADRACSPRATC